MWQNPTKPGELGDSSHQPEPFAHLIRAKPSKPCCAEPVSLLLSASAPLLHAKYSVLGLSSALCSCLLLSRPGAGGT